jgi:molybdopterin-binding protein
MGIQQSGIILLIDAKVDKYDFSALLIDAVASHQWLYVGAKVNLVFKETEVSLAKNLSGMISTRNRMKSTVSLIEIGELISKVTLDFNGFKIVSVITTRSVDMLNLIVGNEVEALVKANEISLMKP